MAAASPIPEPRRFALHNKLVETLGEEEANTMMESLPPIPWTDFATKQDLR